MKATTVTPVVEPDVTLTMTMRQAKHLAAIAERLLQSGHEFFGLFPNVDADWVYAAQETTDCLWNELIHIPGVEDE